VYERYKDALRRGHVAALRGRHDAAIDAYAEAAEIAPDRALPHASVGGILVKMDRLDDALASYERALALGPRDEATLRGLADVQARAGTRTAAAATLDRLADVLDGGGRLADACDAARRALELAESRSRRVQVEGYVARLREMPGDEAARRALAQALRVLEPPEAPTTPEPDRTEVEVEGPADTAADVELESEPEPGEEPEPGQEPEPGDEPEPEPELEAKAEPEPEPEPTEPLGLGIALGATAEAAFYGGEFAAARDGFLAAARSHRRVGRLSAALDACYLAIGIAPSDPDIHVLLAELYLDHGWRGLAIDKLLLLGRLAQLESDEPTRERLCRIATERLPDEPRVASLCEDAAA
jgi:tetratricopeptide (TPR) repeat protein